MRLPIVTLLALTTAIGCSGELGARHDGPNGSGDTDGFLGAPEPSGGHGGSGGESSGSGKGSGAGPASGPGVEVHLEKSFDGAKVISFGVPVPAGKLADVKTVRLSIDGSQIAGNVKELLAEHDASGARTGVRSLLVQLPVSLMPGQSADVEVTWVGDKGPAPGAAIVPFGSDDVSAPSAATARTTVRSIAPTNGGYALVEGPITETTLFAAREPRVLATFPEGYLAATGLLGHQLTAAEAAAPGHAGTAYFSSSLDAFARSAMYEESYALNPDPESVVDPIVDYSGWLYDRCATFLTAHSHLGDPAFLRQAYRSCSWFAGKIELSGPNAGIFSGKPEPDTKYSHLRGLYAYFALTGDESALAAGTAVATMWESEPHFVLPYRAGHTAGVDKLWTERLLATSLEGLYYGHRLTGDPKFMTAYGEILTTAYAHITGDAAALAKINPGVPFPPQGCFIHSGLQHDDAEATDPWCSPWMSELVVDPLLRWQELTDDPRVDQIFLRLGRFLRDVGTAYFDSDLLNDSFLAPSVCDDPSAGENRRRLVPLYGAGKNTSGTRVTFGDWSDFEHCSDASALTAAALRALVRLGVYDQNPVGPFPSEGASLLALHQELLSCAERVFQEETRPKRDPASWTSAELAEGASDPAAFILANRIGFPIHVVMPQRKLSWWFNTAMQQMKLLDEAGIAIDALSPGAIQPSGCP